MMRYIPAVLLAVTALPACTSIPDELASIPAGARYVAMGSSFAAGPGLGALKPGTPARCTRDEGNYPTLLARRLGLELVDVSCSGATSTHILHQWNELPAQVDALTADTRLVTVTIGGNDVNYVGNLFAASCDASSGEACPPVRLPTEAQWAELETSLRSISVEIKRRAPNARVVFVDYLTLVGEGNTCAALQMSPEGSAAMRQVGTRLAAITARVARENDVDLLAAGALSRDRTACDADPWSTGAPGTGPGAPWHPTAAGMSGVADALAARLMASRPSS